MITNFRHVGIVVRDLKKSSIFYQKTLGLKKVVRLFEGDDYFNKLINTPGTTPGKQFKAVIESKYTHYKKTYKGEQ